MNPRHALLAATALLITPAPAPAQEAARAGDRSDFALTIYSNADPATFDPKQFSRQRALNPYNPDQFRIPGYGVVRETRRVELAEGTNTVRFTDVAAGIDPTTVAFKSLTAPDSTAVLEQDYEYDLVGADKLLQKYLGKPITIRRKPASEQSAPESLEATLLSADPGMLVVQDRKGGAALRLIPRQQDLAEIKLPELPEGLITKPTLVWRVAAVKAGTHDAQVSYQTDGLTWRADYNLVVGKGDTRTDVGAWVSILNESGASYPDARLKLVAGDVQRIQPPQAAYAYGMAGMAMARSEVGKQGFQEKSFFEYHLYTLGRKTSLANNSTKQIELFPTREGVPITKTFVYYGLPAEMRHYISPQPNQDRNLGVQSNKKVDIYLVLRNSERNGLGIPLPAGRVRVYKRDEADAALEFVGEDTIEHTPKDEEVMVKLGSAFDVVGERRQTEFNADYGAHWITEGFEITLRNHKKEPVRVIVKENLFRWVNWEITRSSDRYEKQDYRTIHIPVDVKADGERKVTYTVRYTW